MKNNVQFDVEEYEFQSFSRPVNAGEVQEFSFEDLEGKSISEIERHQEIIKLERTKSADSGFDISPIVKQHRGMEEQEEIERENRIIDEVNKRVAKIEEEAYRKGYDEGMSKGREDVYEQTRAATDEKLIALSEMVSDTLSTKEEILKSQKMQLYNLVRNLTKWVILRELKDDGKYIERLLEKLVIEAQTKTNLLIQVDQKHFEQMPEVLEVVQQKLGQFTNVRVETDFDIQGTGVVVESENGIINGSLVEQLNSLDKIFESVGLAAEEENKVETNES
jgi:flagellar assembly protein FliH